MHPGNYSDSGFTLQLTASPKISGLARNCVLGGDRRDTQTAGTTAQQGDSIPWPSPRPAVCAPSLLFPTTLGLPSFPPAWKLHSKKNNNKIPA